MDKTTTEALLFAALSNSGSGDIPASLRNQIAQNTSDIETLTGSGNGSVSKMVSDAIAMAGVGSNDYDMMSNKPQIESRTLAGNKSAEDLNLASRTYVDTQLGNVEALLQTV